MMMERYYLWIYTLSFGWNQIGATDGYATSAELKKTNIFYIMNYKYRILRAEIYEEAKE
jgi:hypothetical protein